MRLETLTERIAKAKEKIEKKQNTIIKKQAQIEKKRAQIIKMGCDPDKDRHAYYETELHHDFYWLKCDIDSLEDDIKRGQKEIEETKKSLEKYEAQLAGEIEKESILLNDVPDSMKLMQAQIVEKWDEYDIERRDRIKKDRHEMEYGEWCKKYRWNDREFMYQTDEQIHKSNEYDAKMLVLNLYYRVRSITGEITDWSGIHATVGTWGMTVLNGFVIGKEGRAEVESILAGGYNIQRLHVRVLVHER